MHNLDNQDFVEQDDADIDESGSVKVVNIDIEDISNQS